MSSVAKQARNDMMRTDGCMFRRRLCTGILIYIRHICSAWTCRCPCTPHSSLDMLYQPSHNDSSSAAAAATCVSRVSAVPNYL